MKICSSIQSIKTLRKKLTGSIGFVPTMGALHLGHSSLILNSNKNCDFTIVSIFVNPIQFNDQKDFNNYPRQEKNDLSLLENLNVDALFIPDQMNFYNDDFSTEIFEKSISNGLEGASRPGHFKGVATVLVKFFNIIQPTHSFFGEKDAQQLRVVKKIVKDLNFNIKIIGSSTIRENSGLAMSSRNKNLSIKSKEKAAVIYLGLEMGRKALINGERNAEKIIYLIHSKIVSEPLSKIIYISIADSKTLKEVQNEIKNDVLVSVAVKIDGVRLIDNFTYLL